MILDFPMVFVVLVLGGTFLCFAKEWIPSELAALAGFAALLAVGILDEKDVGGIFGNLAPATIGAMFNLGLAVIATWLIPKFWPF